MSDQHHGRDQPGWSTGPSGIWRAPVPLLSQRTKVLPPSALAWQPVGTAGPAHRLAIGPGDEHLAASLADLDSIMKHAALMDQSACDPELARLLELVTQQAELVRSSKDATKASLLK